MVGIGGDGLWLHVNASSGVPIYLQLKNQLKRAIAGGTLRPADRLPTVRDLAGQAVVNPNTVARVYRELEREGFVATQRGVGTFVAEGAGSGRAADAWAGLLDAAAERYFTEAAQLGLTRLAAVEHLAKKVRAGESEERGG